MTKRLIAVATLSVALVLSACNGKGAAGTSNRTPTTDDEKGSYALGQEIGIALKGLNSDRIDVDLFFQAIRDTLLLGKSKMSLEEANKAKQELFVAIQKDLAEKTLKEGTAYLAANGKKEGVITTASGLQYKILTEGAGVVPNDSDKVVVHYSGRLIDGTEFDSSIKRGRPFVFNVRTGFVIDGWVEMLKLMKEGSKVEVTIPSELAYKDRPMRVIPPNSVLVFEIELIKVNPTPEQEEALMNPPPPPPAESKTEAAAAS